MSFSLTAFDSIPLTGVGGNAQPLELAVAPPGAWAPRRGGSRRPPEGFISLPRKPCVGSDRARFATLLLTGREREAEKPRVSRRNPPPRMA
jgi:hypothetical protein